MAKLLEPVILGDGIPLRNRICMGSMTRNRCTDANKPTEASVKHYVDRARDGTGLIIAEGTFISPHGAEWPHAPVMYNADHAAAWQKVTSAVHEVGGKIFFQPWHAGRIQNEEMPMLKDIGHPVYAPSKVPAKGGKFRTLEGVPGHTRNLTEIEDPKHLVEQFRQSVVLAKEAGFDGIELLSQGCVLVTVYGMRLKLTVSGLAVATSCTTSSARMQIPAPMHTADPSRTAAGFPWRFSTPSSTSGGLERWESRYALQTTTTTAQSRTTSSLKHIHTILRN